MLVQVEVPRSKDLARGDILGTRRKTASGPVLAESVSLDQDPGRRSLRWLLHRSRVLDNKLSSPMRI